MTTPPTSSPISAAQVDEFIRSRPGKELLHQDLADEAIAITDFIHASPGSSTAYLITTPAGRIVVNTGLGFEGPHHRRLFDAVSTAPTRYIISTQGHTDHVGGVHAFREPGTIFVAQQRCLEAQHDDARVITRMRAWAPVWFTADREQVKRIIAANPGVPFGQDTPTPDLTFDETLAFSVGGLDVELHSGVGETYDGAMVWLPQHRVALISNLLGPLFGHFPNLNTIRGQRYRFAEPYLATIAKLRDLRPELLITGRGEPIRGAEMIDAVLERMYRAVDFIHRETLAGINAGLDVETLMRTITLPPELYVGQGYGQVKWGVKTIWESYLGWFHHEATTELLPVPRARTWADLVSVAGADAVLQLADTRLGEGRVDEATALVEAVLAHDPDHRAGLERALECHRALREDPITTDNFWESGWLDHQIRLLTQRLDALDSPTPSASDSAPEGATR